MDNKKRAIILDMDETLERGSFDMPTREPSMTLRPGLDELIEKLKQAKEQGADVILCTTAKQVWVDRFLALKPECKEVFDRILTSDNEEEWKNFDEENHSLNSEVRWIYESGKPVTTFEYDMMLFVDDNRTEADRLKRVFELEQGRIEKDVTFFSAYGYRPPDTYEIFGIIEAAKRDEEIENLSGQYLKTIRSENGCSMMCLAIDDFMQREYQPGLTLIDDKYEEQHREYVNKAEELADEIRERMYDLGENLGIDFDNIVFDDKEAYARYERFFEADKHYPFEGIEDNRDKLEGLVEEAAKKQAELGEAEQLLQKYKRQDLKGEKAEEKEKAE